MCLQWERKISIFFSHFGKIASAEAMLDVIPNRIQLNVLIFITIWLRIRYTFREEQYNSVASSQSIAVSYYINH